MTPAMLIAFALLWPLVVTAWVVAVGDRNPNLRDGGMVALGLGLFPAVAMLWNPVASGELPRLVLFELFPGVPLAFEVEPLGLVFALVASFLWPVTAVYGVGYLRGHHEDHQTRFFTFFSAAISAAMGIAFAGNLLTLFVFYEVLTLSTYPLVTHHQDHAAQRAGRIYLGILLTTSVCFLLLGIVLTWALAGTLDFRPGGILAGHVEGWPLVGLVALYAFGIGKAALMPFHRWLPNAMVAPTPVSALLHAVAVVKAGVFSVLKVVVYVFGLGVLTDSGASIWLMYLAAYTILVASIVAMTKDNLKERLAYSTISQLSYIVLGAALATPDGVVGGGMHLVMHAFGKITLFYVAGAIMVANHKKNISQMDGLGRAMPLTYAAWFIGACSVIGVPPTGGSWSKLFLALGAASAEQPVLVFVFMLSSLLNVWYLGEVFARGVFLAPTASADDHGASSHAADGHDPADGGADAHPADPHDHGHHADREALPLTLAPPLLSALGCVVLFFAWPPLHDLLRLLPLGEGL